MIKTVLFDLDGTLLNTIDDLADAGNWVCTQNGWPTFTVEQFKHMVGNGIPKLVERFSPEDARSQEQLAATLAQFSARYDAHKEDKTAPYAGIDRRQRQMCIRDRDGPLCRHPGAVGHPAGKRHPVRGVFQQGRRFLWKDHRPLFRYWAL